MAVAKKDKVEIGELPDFIEKLAELDSVRPTTNDSKKRVDALTEALKDYIAEKNLDDLDLTFEATRGTIQAELVKSATSYYPIHELSVATVRWLAKHQVLTVNKGVLDKLYGREADETKASRVVGEDSGRIVFTEVKGY